MSSELLSCGRLFSFSHGLDYWKPFHDVAQFAGGFYIGMLAMYIAVHLYKWK